MIYKNELFALKRIPKSTIDKAKRIEHLKNEKKVGLFLKEKIAKPSYFVELEETFADLEAINFMFEFLPGQDLFWVIQNEMNLKLGA